MTAGEFPPRDPGGTGWTGPQQSQRRQDVPKQAEEPLTVRMQRLEAELRMLAETSRSSIDMVTWRVEALERALWPST